MTSIKSNTFAFQCNNGGDESIASYIYNLTSSYADKSNESSVVATSVIMFVLAAVFFNLNLFSRVSYVSGVLNPTVRLVLSTALSLFLPVMSYLFSEAKNANRPGLGPDVRGRSPDLPLPARMILTWMLLVELLRKKVEAILMSGAAAMQGTSSIIGHVTSVLWLGNLVFFNLKGAGRKAVFGILWVLCAAKLVQRIVVTELGKRSLAYGMNARLLSSYMAQMLREGDEHRDAIAAGDDGSARLKACKYVVMGEEEMVKEAGPHGYKLDLGKITAADDGGVVTVGKIWRQLDEVEANRPRFKSAPRLKRLTLSFALFKLLRRRFEPLPSVVPAMAKEEADDCRRLIFKGLCKEEGVADPEVALFQVINDEVNFLSEYYHSVLPVMFASPYFFLVNYFVLPVVVLGLCAMTVVLCANGNISFAIKSIQQDNYALSFGIIDLTKCLWENVLKYPQAFFSTIDISISYLLFLAVVYEEVWEFIIFVLSNWFSVSLLCNYTARTSWRRNPIISWALRRISWVRNKLTDTSLIMCKQFSVLSFCWLSMALPVVPLPKLAKLSIMERLMAYGYDDGPLANHRPLSNGRSTLLLGGGGGGQQWPSSLSRFCDSDSVAEVIATWHIATSLLENKCQQQQQQSKRASTSRPHHADDPKMKVATMLSKYCAYLVAFHPDLLPDDQQGTKRVYEAMKKDLKVALGGCWGYYVSSQNGRYHKLMSYADSIKRKDEATDMTVVDKGVVLGKELVAKLEGEQQEPVWELLAQLWVELVVYIGPSGSDEHDKAHEAMLVHGGELVTLLWALTTHTGIARLPADTIISRVENIEEGSVHLS